MNGRELIYKAKAQDDEIQLKAKMLLKSAKILGLHTNDDKNPNLKPKPTQKPYIIKKAIRGKSETVKQLISVMKNQDVVIANKNTDNNKLYSLYATRNCVVDYASLEVQLNQYNDLLGKQKQLNKDNKQKLEDIQSEIKTCETVVEDNKYLFRNRNTNPTELMIDNDDLNYNLQTYSDKDDIGTEKNDHSISLLHMLRQKHATCVKKLDHKQKEFERLQKELHYTELNELFIDITELKNEIARIDDKAEEIVKDLYSNIDFVRNKPEAKASPRNDLLTANGKSRVVFCEDNLSNIKSQSTSRRKNSEDRQDNENSDAENKNSGFKPKPSGFSSSARKREKSRSARKEIQNDTSGYKDYDKMRIFLINHIIIQQLYQSNQGIYTDIECINTDNKRVYKLNGLIEAKITTKKKSLNKTNIERQTKSNALSTLQDKENQEGFHNRQSELKDGLE